MTTRSLRKLWLAVHRWLGLCAGFHFVLLGLSGSPLVYFKELDSLIADSRYSPQAPSKQIASLNQMAQKLLQDSGARTQLIYVIPGKLSSTLEFWLATSPEKEAQAACNFERTSGSLLGCWTWSETFMSWIYEFHHALFSGPVGETIVGITGLLVLILLFTGIILWWPRSKFQWKTAFVFLKSRNLIRQNFDLHRLLGLYSSFALIIITFSGVALTFHDTFRSVVNIAFETRQHAEHMRPHEVPKNLFDEALKIAMRSHPKGELVYISVPTTDRGAYEVGLSLPEDPKMRGVLTELWIDPVENKILEARPFNRRSLGDKIVTLQFPIHNGEVFGTMGRIGVLVMGLIPMILFTTGLVLFLKKRRPNPKHQKSE